MHNSNAASASVRRAYEEFISLLVLPMYTYVNNSAPLVDNSKPCNIHCYNVVVASMRDRRDKPSSQLLPSLIIITPQMQRK
jgi:hypothetical protein